MRPDPQGPFKRDPPAPYRMRDRLTHTQDVIVLCHLGIPRIERDQWSLTVHGMVERPLTLRFDDLVRYPKTEVASVHQCCDNPLAPFVPTRRVSNVIWGGVRLTDVLADCRPSPAAQYIWSYGADFGEFNGVAVEAYVKDLPITRIAADVLIGYELDGARHETRETTPVWSIAPESLIVSPAPLRRSSCRPSRKSGAGPGQMTGFATSTSAPTTRQHGGGPNSSHDADASGSAFRCAGCRSAVVQWCWLHSPKQQVGCSSLSRGGATRFMKCR